MVKVRPRAAMIGCRALAEWVANAAERITTVVAARQHMRQPSPWATSETAQCHAAIGL